MKTTKLPDLVKVLVIDGGGRGHAFVWKLAQSPRVTHLWCAPGNVLIAKERLKRNNELVRCVPIGVTDVRGLVTFCIQNSINLVVIGQEAALFCGVSDALRAVGIAVWGPSRAAAELERSKAFFQGFAEEHGIPVAQGDSFQAVEPAMKYAAGFDFDVAVKASGPCEGKGVLLSKGESGVRRALERCLCEDCFGEAGKTVVVQKRLQGYEASLHALFSAQGENSPCSDELGGFVAFDSSKDHKRVDDDEKEAIGGGSGTISPHPNLSSLELASITDKILAPLHAGCVRAGLDDSGLIFPGIMVTPEGPAMLECNWRAGDPEWQVLMMRLVGDLMDIIARSLDGTLRQCDIVWDTRVAVCIIMMAKGYPNTHTEQRGRPIRGLSEVLGWSSVKVFGAGIAVNGDDYVVNGGRVLGVSALADTLAEASALAYGAAFHIDAASGYGWAHYRLNIGGVPLYH